MIRIEIYHKRGCVYALEYHIVWATKYRRKILSNKIGARLGEILNQCAVDNEFKIEEYNFCSDHVHLLVSMSLHHDIPKAIKLLKGISAKKLFEEFPELKKSLWGGHMWNPSYFIATVSKNTEQQIRCYIQAQQKGG